MSKSKYFNTIQTLYKSYAKGNNFTSLTASGCRVVNVDEGRVKVEFEVTDNLTNTFGTLHGGATATLFDIVTTTAVLASEKQHPGVSVDLNVSYMSAGKLGETLEIDAEVIRRGRTLAFTRAELRRKSDLALLAVALHTKAFPTLKWIPFYI